MSRFCQEIKRKGFREGRENSGERKTFWKGIRLVAGINTDQQQDVLA
jgi:hypothetical protein